MTTKAELRAILRKRRREYDAALPPTVRALMFHRPPTPVVERIAADAVIGLYSAVPGEAPTTGYVKWFHESGHQLALPWFAERGDTMRFRQWPDPYVEDVLGPGPYAISQPTDDSTPAEPDVVFVPLLGFTAQGERLGQGAGHYDTWLASHPGTLAIGLAWDCQLVDTLPVEAHDHPLDMIITPTRCYEVAQ